MKKIKKNKNRIVFGIIVLLTLIVSFIIYNKFDNDGMDNSGIYKIKYRVSQNGIWSDYSKNGMSAGDKENPIQNIQFKVKEKEGRVYFYTYTNKWSEQNFKVMSSNSNKIYGLKINTSNLLHKKYDVCYRTYNKKDKWLNWTCNGEISGNKDEPITALEIKIIPKGSVRFDYLKDFNKELETMKNF